MRKRRHAFTMMEVLFAAALIAFGVLAVFSVLSYSTRAAQVASRQGEALNYARQALDLIRARNLAFTAFPAVPDGASGLGDLSGQRRALNASPLDQDLPGGTGLERNIVCTRVNTDPAHYEFELMRITVTIFYTEQGHGRQIQLQALQARP